VVVNAPARDEDDVALADFMRLPVAGDGQRPLETSGAGDLWLQNKAGVVMDLTGTQTGVTLSLGKDEIIIELGKAK